MSYDISTLEVPVAERFDYWTSIVCSRCIPAESRTFDSDDFAARLQGRTLGKIAVSVLHAPAHTWERDERHVRTATDDDIWLAFMESGSGTFAQNGRTMVQRPGDLMMYDSGRPFSHNMAEQSLYLARIPRYLLSPRMALVERLTATRLGEGMGVTTLLGQMIKESATAPELENKPGACGRMANSIVDLLLAMLDMQSQSSVSTKSSSQEALYYRALSVIDERVTDTELGVESLCRNLHVSPRTLTRTFAMQGTTVMRCILQRRLEASHTALLEGTVRNVTEAAMTFGFCDISHFSRSYKGFFGASPQTAVRKLKA